MNQPSQLRVRTVEGRTVIDQRTGKAFVDGAMAQVTPYLRRAYARGDVRLEEPAPKGRAAKQPTDAAAKEA